MLFKFFELIILFITTKFYHNLLFKIILVTQIFLSVFRSLFKKNYLSTKTIFFIWILSNTENILSILPFLTQGYKFNSAKMYRKGNGKGICSQDHRSQSGVPGWGGHAHHAGCHAPGDTHSADGCRTPLY